MIKNIAVMAALTLVASAGIAWAGGGSGGAVPEPASLALLATAVGGFAIAKFRRRR